MVRVISISDEVYLELSKMKDGKSFTELLKEMINKCETKGDGRKILEFIKSHEPISDEEAERVNKEIVEARKRTTPRNFEQT